MKSLDLRKPDDCRWFIGNWAESFKKMTGKDVDSVTSSTGRDINFSDMTDDEAIWIANDLYQMDREAEKNITKQ
jgi:hypothetical protein